MHSNSIMDWRSRFEQWLEDNKYFFFNIPANDSFISESWMRDIEQVGSTQKGKDVFSPKHIYETHHHELLWFNIDLLNHFSHARYYGGVKPKKGQSNIINTFKGAPIRVSSNILSKAITRMLSLGKQLDDTYKRLSGSGVNSLPRLLFRKRPKKMKGR